MRPAHPVAAGASRLGPPIDARPLFGAELAALLDTLRGLRPADWRAPAVPGWTVRDLAVHLLGAYQGRLGAHQRVRRPGERLEAFIHRTNQEWVDRHADEPPARLPDALERAGGRLVARFASADLAAPALGVSWAGVDPAPAWLDIAREYTEYWTHRQQIRHAVGQPTDPEPRALATVLDTFLRALPHTLRHTAAPAGSRVAVVVEGQVGGRWTATATADGWSLSEPPGGAPTASVVLDPETAWRLCTRGIDPGTAVGRARPRGDRRLAEAACRIVSIVH
ncbi:maleylpyruvate isomerase family mycothiol-dependent enzyme [Streptomyces sp. DSM 44915]|uniref:Maleylpyruvate isomerase family mycothiol-dependent enzyme n=1 Tax=Streptomyces chisholmiae TaxID=3075540 RepID=A0ABU2JVH4_9ACTN|nr:maleylpyruvate isomerase family mycothiol-dependent enzyme [Streptomyces sp. DSM 44915]MDT0268976.1 maleylpyruvate isomerase family mycothiol-dependent enzyme [Streptomyces sp. DSM 44915]